MSEAAWAYLRKQEWSMGNGQCPECHECGPSWLGFGGWGNSIGHKKDCGMATSLVALGQDVVWSSEYDRHADAGSPLGLFGKVNGQSPKTQALLEQIAKAHPEMVRTGSNTDSVQP
jgi:hypothetical protein